LHCLSYSGTIPVTQSIIDAICACPVSVTAREEAARLAESYIARFSGDSKRWQVLAVESPFYMWLDPFTLIVGVMDSIRRDQDGQVEGLELKTRRAPKIKKDGQPYKGDTEQDWLAEISNSPQLAIYAMAMRQGTFVNLCPTPVETVACRIRVRCAVKSTPAAIWPTQDDGLFQFSSPLMDKTQEALLSAAASIRAHRQRGTVPWQLQGHWCSQFGRDCVHLPVCRERKNPTGAPKTLHSATDPGSVAIAAAIGANPVNDSLVILSASSYGDWGTCSELYRLNSGGYFPAEESEAMDIGKAFHVAVGAWHKEGMPQGNTRPEDNPRNAYYWPNLDKSQQRYATDAHQSMQKYGGGMCICGFSLNEPDHDGAKCLEAVAEYNEGCEKEALDKPPSP